MTRKRVARSLKERQIEKNNTRSVSSLFQIFIRNMRKNLSCPKQNKENERQIFFNKNFPSTLQETRQSSYFLFSLSLTFFNILRINSQETLCGIGGGQSREKINFGKRRGTISGRNLHGCGLLKTWHEWRKYFSFRGHAFHTIFTRPYSTGDIYF